MHLITYTNLFPDVERPRHGIFVLERLHQLLRQPGVDASVVALRPGYRTVHSKADRLSESIPVVYQPVPSLPKVTNWIDPWLWARASTPAVREITEHQGNDVVLDAHFLYPDGVAAMLIGLQLNLPVVLTARGSDVNLKCANPVMRRWIRWAAARCDALITVSGALLEQLQKFNIRCSRMKAIPNGVDTSRFKPLDQGQSRREFGIGGDGEVLLTVGHLVRAKGHHVVIGALPRLPGMTLVVAGEGPEEGALRALVDKLGLHERVRFLGSVDPQRMPMLYSAADTLVLASEREGMPNVVLESLACGVPVVASEVGGIPEVVTSPAAGKLVVDCSESGIAGAVRTLSEDRPSRAQTRECAMAHGWQPRIAEQVALYQSVLDSRRTSPHA